MKLKEIFAMKHCPYCGNETLNVDRIITIKGLELILKYKICLDCQMLQNNIFQFIRNLTHIAIFKLKLKMKGYEE